MSQPPSQDEIDRLLKKLESPDELARLSAVETLGRLGLHDDEIMLALKQVESNDTSKAVQREASIALANLGRPPSAGVPPPILPGKNYTSRQQRIIEFAIGFVAWYLLNGAVWLSFLNGRSINSLDVFSVLGVFLFLLLVNLLILIVLAFLRRWMAFGILVAFAVNLAITLVLGMTTNATCAVPFFIKATGTSSGPSSSAVPTLIPTPRPTQLPAVPLAQLKATAQAALTATPARPNWSVVLSDPFDHPRNDWTVQKYSTGAWTNVDKSIADGKYQWSVTAKNANVLDRDLPSVRTASDFAVSVDGRRITGTESSSYGLVFRDDHFLFYVFDIADDGSYKFSKGFGESAGDTVLNGKTNAIHPNQVNRVTVVAQGTHFTFYVNDQYVAQADDNSRSGNSVGIAVEVVNAGDMASFEFDNFEVRAP